MKNLTWIVFLAILSSCLPSFAQLSPGPLSGFHSHLEGLSKCTSCHDIGKKVTNSKCLACHTELKSRIESQKGYHASAGVKGKECISCHNEHHGVNFRIVKFEEKAFDHTSTGYPLKGAHLKKHCKDCHKAEFIVNPEIKKKKYTYLGLPVACAGCHADYHRKTLSDQCGDCHGFDAFKPASLFNHDKAKYRLRGEHQKVSCDKCHKMETRDGKKFQVFTGIPFNSCSNCHLDVHKGKFGQNCNQCHMETSFRTLKADNSFNHNLTDFKLEGKHREVKCASCHKTSVTAPLKHNQCLDCHKDYHQGELVAGDMVRDCAVCHNTQGFAGSSYTLEQHNLSQFPLKGAHQATPCNSCHKKQERWTFRSIGKVCVDCHKNIHDNYISEKYYPESNCEVCHNSDRWDRVTFDHSVTSFKLRGSHEKQACKACHFSNANDGTRVQKFAGLSASCVNCHPDRHFKQFDIQGMTSCERCHQEDSWKIKEFDHDKTAFKLQGKHRELSCDRCHHRVENHKNIYVLYKTGKIRCEDCHS